LLLKGQKKNKLKGKSQEEIYDAMNAGEWSHHKNTRGNSLFSLANLMASLIYKIKHPKESH